MSEVGTNSKSVLHKCFNHLYGEIFAQQVELLYETSTDEQKIYIIGCLLLTLTASVHPSQTLVARRVKSYEHQFCTPTEANERSLAGLFAQDDGAECRLICFHCSARLKGLAHGWDSHRSASPNCYFVRFRDFVINGLSQPSLGESFRRDVDRYVRALRKLYNELTDSQAVRIASNFGYSELKLTFCATRYFMRNGGQLPARAGDLIAEVHKCEDAFDEILFLDADVKLLLKPLKLLHNQPVVVAGLNRSGRMFNVSAEQMQQLERILRQHQS